MGAESAAIDHGSGDGGSRHGRSAGSSGAGSNLMLGALGGGLIGATSALLGASQIAEFRVQGLPVGGFEARQGPVLNRNFPFVVLNRFLVLADALKQRTHAHREQLVMKEGDLAQKFERLDKRQQQLIHRALNRLSRQRSVEGLPAVLTPLLLWAIQPLTWSRKDSGCELVSA